MDTLEFQDDYDVFKFPASSINNMLYAILIATSTLALLVLSTAIIVLTKHCVRRRRETKAMNKLCLYPDILLNRLFKTINH